MSRKEKISNKVLLIEINKIKTNPSQPRTCFDEEGIKVLAKSIEDNGLLQPVTLRKNFKNEYELISGERRLRACKSLGYNYIDAIVIEKTSKESAILALIENLHREDLDIFEQARALKLLIANWNVTQEEAATRLSMTQSTIANKLRILKLTDEEQRVILENSLTERHARALLKVKEDDKRLEVLKYIIENQLNVQDSEKYIENLDNKKPTFKKKPMKIKDIKIFTNTINRAVKIMQESGINVSVDKQENPEYIEYLVKIPTL